MNKETIHCCQLMDLFLEDVRIPICYSAIYREYDIPLLYKNKITALQSIFYCPWCRKKLPKSLRKKWFQTLKAEYNITDPWHKDEKRVPQEFNSDEWWKKRSL